MRQPNVEIRYPDGGFEIVAGEQPPPRVGDTLRLLGRTWKVVRRKDTNRLLTVEVEPTQTTSSSSTPILTLRFPDGEVEHRTTESELPLGVLVRARGVLWRVAGYERSAVILELAGAEDRARHGPEATDPTALGKTPIQLETIIEV